jgi:hypothetical protein
VSYEQVQHVRADDIRHGDTVIDTAGERYRVSDIETYRDDAGTWLRLIDEAYDRCLECPPDMMLPVVRGARPRQLDGAADDDICPVCDEGIPPGALGDEPADIRCTCRVPDA